jgi:hypothetical protein
MLSLLECPFESEMLRNAGNDANFTLRTLTLIAATDATNDPNSEPVRKALLWVFERITREPLPREKFLEAVKAQLKREHNRAQNRRQRRNTPLEKDRAK